jgi:GNAT superfamily N-acetyltransferase
MMIQIRHETEADAAEAVDTLRRSITELCIADHQNDPTGVEGWLCNKTVDAWCIRIARDDAVVLVAEQGSKVIGVGMVTLSGDILFNYIRPEIRFDGVSEAILAGLEEVLRSRDVHCCRLESTITAQSFYENCGFRSEGDDAFRLSKSL